VHERTRIGHIEGGGRAMPLTEDNMAVKMEDYVTVEVAAVVEGGGTVLGEGTVVGVASRIGRGAVVGKVNGITRQARLICRVQVANRETSTAP
jgi:dynactin-6